MGSDLDPAAVADLTSHYKKAQDNGQNSDAVQIHD
jgi:hypothetical protein